MFQIVEEVTLNLQTEDPEPVTNLRYRASDFEDLWSPKKIPPQVFAQTLGACYFCNILSLLCLTHS